MCTARPSVPSGNFLGAIKPSADTLPPDAIQSFLLKYPTPDKYNGDSNYWNSVAGTQAGQDFLKVHGANRRAAGDTVEADAIGAALKLLDPTRITRLPTLPPPDPSKPASYVARADSTTTLPLLPAANQQIATNRAGSSSLTIPLISQPQSGSIRLPLLPTR